MQGFVHLHTHSYFSYDGVASVQEMVRRAAELKMPALAITDHNSIAGVEELYRYCEAEGIRPIIGVELKVKPLVLTNREEFTIILLAENEAGYRNLCRLLSCDKVCQKELVDYSGGLIVLMGGERSELYAAVAAMDKKAVEDYLNQMASIYPLKNLLIELQAGADKEHQQQNQRLYKLAKYLQLQVVATNDVHYLQPEERICHLFLCGAEISAQKLLRDYMKKSESQRNLHLASAEQMKSYFADMPEALENTSLIAERCEVKLSDLSRQSRLYSYERGRDPESFLWDLLCQRVGKYFPALTVEIKERINEEFNYITAEGLAEFLIFHYKLQEWLKEHEIVATITRGHILSSLIAYVLGINEVNPLKFRFRFSGLKDKREQLPEIYIELAEGNRGRLINYLLTECGAEQIAGAGKFRYWHKGASLLEVCKWAGLSVRNLTRKFTSGEEKSKGQRTVLDYINDALELKSEHSDFALLVAMANRLAGRPRGYDWEKGGVIIAPQRIDNILPLGREINGGLRVAMVNKGWVDKLRLIKIYLVNSTALNIIKDTLAQAGKEEGVVSLPKDLADDERVFRFLATGKTEGIPFFEGVSVQSLLRHQQPKDIFQLVRLRATLKEQRAKGEEAASRTQTEKEELSIYRIVAECLLAYKCAFLRIKYPQAYITATLKNYFKWQNKFKSLLLAQRYEGVNILSPDVNLSEFDFIAEENGFRAGLGIVRGIGKKVYEEIAHVRRGGAINDLVDLCRRTDSHLVNYRVVENLIKSGALDGFELKRSEMLALLDKAVMLARQRYGENVQSVTPDFFAKTLEEITWDSELTLPRVPELAELPLRQIFLYEKQATGIILSGYGFEAYAELLAKMKVAPLWRLIPRLLDKEVHFVGMIAAVERKSILCQGEIEAALSINGFLVLVPHRVYLSARRAIFKDEPVLIGGKVLKQDGELYVRAHYLQNLGEVEQKTEQTNELVINMLGENKKTVRLIYQLMRAYPGKTKVRLENLSIKIGGRLMRRIKEAGLLFCPPVYFQLLKLLPERSIQVIVKREPAFPPFGEDENQDSLPKSGVQ